MANWIPSWLCSGVSEWLDHILVIVGPSRPALDANQAARDLTRKHGESKFRLEDAETSDRLTLPGGRCLGYAQFGSPSGRPIIALHGLMGSRYDYASLGPIAQKLDIRLICPERPGIGWSTPAGAEYTLLDHAHDVQRLADHLGLKEYGVLGTSGGGPYALACAASTPKDIRLKAATVVCGVGTPDMSSKGMSWMYWMGFGFGFRLFPGLCKLFMKGDITTRLDLPDPARLGVLMDLRRRATPHPREAEALRDVDLARAFLRSSREAHAQGFDGWARDGARVSSPWGFQVQDVPDDLPVSLWYGKADTNVPITHGEQIAARLGGRAAFHVTHETHGSLQVHWNEAYLKELVERMG